MMLAMLAIGSAAGFFAAKFQNASQLRQVESKASALREELLLTQGQLEQLRVSNRELSARREEHGELLQALTPLQKQLDLVNRQVSALDQHTAGASEKLLNQLANDAKLQAELRNTANELSSALRSTSARGNWGEMQLQRIFEAAGMIAHVDFSLQQQSSNFTDGILSNEKRGLRPDATVHLPNGGHLAIDAKVPLSAYLKAQAITGNDAAQIAAKAQYLNTHAKALAAHVKELVKRNYPADFTDSPQLTVLFVPSEALLAEALERDPTLLENSFRDGVVLTSPTSLLALLRAIATIWASSAATTEAAKIVNLGRTLIDRLNVTTKHLNSLGKSLSASVKHYNSALGSLESRVLTAARQFDSIETEGLELTQTALQISAEAGQVRQFVDQRFTIQESDSDENLF
ncbi:DNA recombination protein RmuC [Arcanobacterium hippocoleae]